MKYFIDFKLENNEEKIEKNNINALYSKNKYIKFSYEEENIDVKIKKDSIIMKKENKDSIIIFNFLLNKKSQTKYYIKELDFYIDTEILTNKLIKEDKYIYIEYELWLSGEYTGKYTYQIDIKEM